MDPDFSELHVCCMRLKTGWHVDKVTDYDFDRIPLLVKLMETVANEHTTSWIITT